MRILPGKYSESPDAWQTKVQEALYKVIRLPFPMPWAIIGAVLFAIGYGLTFDYANYYAGADYKKVLIVIAIQSALIAVVANSVVFFERLLDDVADTFPVLLDESSEVGDAWIAKWYDNIFWSKKNLVTGLILGGIYLFGSIYAVPTLFASTAGKVYSLSVIFIIGFLGGSMFWAMLGIARLTASMGREVKIKPSIFDGNINVLRTASSVLWKVSLTAGFAYTLGVSIYYFDLIDTNATITGLIVFFGGFIIFYFIIPHINIRKTLLKIKSKRLRELAEQIDRAFDTVTGDPIPENILKLNELLKIQDTVNKKKAWSFGSAELLTLLGTILVPLVGYIFS